MMAPLKATFPDPFRRRAGTRGPPPVFVKNSFNAIFVAGA